MKLIVGEIGKTLDTYSRRYGNNTIVNGRL